MALCGRGVAGSLHPRVLALNSGPGFRVPIRKRKKGRIARPLFLNFDFPALSANRYARWPNVAKLPSNQDADEQQHRKTYPERQCARHAAGFGLAMGTVFQHEKKRSTQAAENG